METLWNIGELPFVWSMLDKPTNGDDLPDRIPFLLGIDRKTGTLIQIPNDPIASVLEVAYRKGSKIAGMMGEEDAGNKYAYDFLEYLKGALRTKDFTGKKILDIGCGSGFLLFLLKELGAEVMGIEPGEIGQYGSKKYNLPIIKSTFSSHHVADKFDIIISTFVLEHIKEPLNFLHDCTTLLKDDGSLLLSVPNCEPFIEVGDISMLIHEHYNYFTSLSLKNILDSAGLDSQIRMSSYGNSLYTLMRKIDGQQNKYINSDVLETDKCLVLARDFKLKARAFIKKIEEYFHRITRSGQTLGVYVPSRLINVLSIINVDLSKCRFFDDDLLMHNTYFPSFDIPIENRESLLNRPTDHLFIASYTFGEKIKNQIISIEDIGTKITTWSDIISSEKIVRLLE